MLQWVVRALWGELNKEELKKFLLLALGFFFLIGSYWPLKILKDVVFINMVGSAYQPDAKILSLLIFFPLVLGYSKFVDYFSKEKLIYCFVALFGCLGFVFVYFFYHPTIGVACLDHSPYRILGWAFYLFVEGYISVMVAVYWAFIHDVTTPESAARGYGIIIAGSQLGAVVFILLGNYLSHDPLLYVKRVPLIALISVVMFCLVAFMTFLVTHTVSKVEMQGYQVKHAEEDQSVGFFEGLKVLLRFPYVAGIFGLVFFHETVSALMNYQMLRAVETTYYHANPQLAQGLVNKFMFDFTLIMQSISCAFALFGASYFQRKFGVRGCLIAYPVLLMIGISLYFCHPTLWFIAGVMVIAKGINYVLNQPAKEMLYIPTTKAVKYKAKAWTDMFGLRSAKMAGSLVNMSVGLAVGLTSGISLILVVMWVALSRSIGTYYKKVLQKGERIGM
jgi:ATP/ADP translocase